MTRRHLSTLVPLAVLAALGIVMFMVRDSIVSEGDLRAPSRTARAGPVLGEESSAAVLAELADPPSADGDRKVVQSRPAPVPGAPGPARLSIVLQGGGEPYPGCIVRFDANSGAAVDIPGADGRIGVTDQEGRVTFRVPPDSTLAVEVIPFGTDAVERWSVQSPAPGQSREFTISLPPRSVQTSQPVIFMRLCRQCPRIAL